MKYCGGTFSGYKAILCAEEITVVGHRCTPDGRLPDESRVEKVLNWGPCIDVSDVRAFLGTIGVCRMFIRNFAHRANPPHHVNPQEPAIRLQSRTDICTGRPLTGLNRITCAPPDRLQFDFIRYSCSRHIPNCRRIPSLSMFH